MIIWFSFRAGYFADVLPLSWAGTKFSSVFNMANIVLKGRIISECDIIKI